MLTCRVSLREEDAKRFYKNFIFPATQNKTKQIKAIILDHKSITSMDDLKQYFQTSMSKVLMNYDKIQVTFLNEAILENETYKMKI